MRTIQIVLFISVLVAFACSEKPKKQVKVPNESPLFKLRKSSETGIDFANTLTEDKYRNIIRYQGYYDGGGVATADFNNDGLIDLFFTANSSPNAFYVNKGGFRFEDQTAKAGLQKEGFGWYNGVTVVDINNDGWMDMYVCRSGNLQPENRKNMLYINNGDLTFTDQAAEYGLDHSGYSAHGAFFDFDNDGDLDMYLANYGIVSSTSSETKAAALRRQRDEFSGDKLFENKSGQFIDVTRKAGIFENHYGFAQSVGIGDFNNDGWEDIYVCNDFFEDDYLYINQGNKTFVNELPRSMNHTSSSSMGNDIADFNNDGLLDIIVLDMVAEDNRRMKENLGGFEKKAFDFFVDLGFHYQYMFNTLQLNHGNDTYSEIAHLAGIPNTDWSWAPLFADFDNDGLKDLYITNGLKKDARNLDAKYEFEAILRNAHAQGRTELTDEEWTRGIESMPAERLKNYMYKNNGDLTFSKVTDSWGLGYASFSSGAAYADLDNDGDLDIVVNNITDKAYIFENTAKNTNYLKIRLQGSGENINGLGAKVEIFHNGHRQLQQNHFSRGFRSAMANDLHFGLGADQLIDSLVVQWPGRKMQIFKELQVNRTLELKYADAELISKPKATKPKILSDVTPYSNLKYTHQQPLYDDFLRELHLPYKLSASGPVLAKGDVNGDGLEDVFIGGSEGYVSQIYLQTAEGRFTRSSQPAFNQHIKCLDGGAAFFDIDNDNDLDLYVSSGGNIAPENSKEYTDRLYLNDGKGRFKNAANLIPEITTSNSCVVPHDFDRDGDMDLFVGGRLMPALYPYSPNCLLLENQQGKLVDVSMEKAPVVNKLGMVNAAKWIDYDLDGDDDLVIVGEWMPITILKNESGTFEDVTVQAGLAKSSGWWQTVQTADMDQDGDMDLIAGNLGLNSKYKASAEYPFEIFAGDMDNNGTHDAVLAYWQEGKQYPVRDRLLMMKQFPFIEKKIPAFSQFAVSQMTDIFPPEALSKSTNYKVHQFASCYIQNNGDGTFSMIELPLEAQFSSINAIIPTDIDHDSVPDLIVAGNLYQQEAETARNDASYGLVLQGDGKGSFISLPWSKSGLSVAGDVKSAIALNSAHGSLFIFGKNNGRIQLYNIAK
jgi:hypothetical protein